MSKKSIFFNILSELHRMRWKEIHMLHLNSSQETKFQHIFRFSKLTTHKLCNIIIWFLCDKWRQIKLILKLCSLHGIYVRVVTVNWEDKQLKRTIKATLKSLVNLNDPYMKSKLPPLRFACVSGFWDKHQWEIELHQTRFQKLGHFHHLTPFSDFHEQYLKNNPKHWEQLIRIPRNISLVQMENNRIITADWVLWQGKTHHGHDVLCIVFLHLLWLRNHTMNRITLSDFYTNFIIIFLFVLYSRTQFPKTKYRQSKPNFNSHKPPSPHGFNSWTPSIPLLF